MNKGDMVQCSSPGVLIGGGGCLVSLVAEKFP